MHVASYAHNFVCLYIQTESDGSESDCGVVAAVASIVTLIVSVTATAVITFIITYLCVQRKFEYLYNHPRHQSTQQKVLYEEVESSSSTITRNNLELQPNPAYQTSHKVIMDTNPAYESCK